MITRPNRKPSFFRKIEFNSPSTPPITITTPASKEWRTNLYQLEITCPFCGQPGYSQWNIIRLDVILNFPLCWPEECCYCKEVFSVTNNLTGVCIPCKHQLDCLEKPLGTMKLIQSF